MRQNAPTQAGTGHLMQQGNRNDGNNHNQDHDADQDESRRSPGKLELVIFVSFLLPFVYTIFR
jgi:hypothetical protein